MKVYELMDILSRIPAGENVKISICVTSAEFLKNKTSEDECIITRDIETCGEGIIFGTKCDQSGRF